MLDWAGKWLGRPRVPVHQYNPWQRPNSDSTGFTAFSRGKTLTCQQGINYDLHHLQYKLVHAGRRVEGRVWDHPGPPPPTVAATDTAIKTHRMLGRAYFWVHINSYLGIPMQWGGGLTGFKWGHFYDSLLSGVAWWVVWLPRVRGSSHLKQWLLWGKLF